MCGVTGIFSAGSDITNQIEDLERMSDSLSHRGPDDQGSWIDAKNGIALSHRRLSIIDLSLEGRQPMVSNCGRYVISLNGEIYNFLELRSELEDLEVQFRGKSDTEVFLSAISQWGVSIAIQKSIGMFAFALWDHYKKQIILARDRSGKKPLYYILNKNKIYFASEIKALKNIRDIHFQIDYNSIYQYLTFGYIPAPKTIYKNISEVQAGHYLAVDKNLNLKTTLYWSIDWGKKRSVSFSDAVEQADHLLNEAVKIRLRSDVPLGCFLSGGIDSGLLTAIASKQMNKKLKTFTVSFSDDVFDESPLAKLVSQRYETDHHIIKLSPDIENIIPKVVKAYDEPFADASTIPSFCVSAEASAHLKVVLNGEGADELFGGYRRHFAIKFFKQLKAGLETIPERYWIKLLHTLPAPRSFRSKYAFAHRFLRGVVKNPFKRYIAWCVDGFDEYEKFELYKNFPEHNSSVDFLSERFSMMENLHPVDSFMAIDFLLNMHDDMLVKMDIATMAHGLEGRNPFLDQRIIEWAASLPPEIKLKGKNTKPILRELSKRYLPAPLVNTPKRGFEIPLIRWLREDLFQMVHDICLSPNGILMDLFSKKYVTDLLFEKHDMDPDRWSKRVWTIFMLAMWKENNR